MARKLTVALHLTVAEVPQRYRGAEDPVARSQWHILWLLAGGMHTAEVARVTGYGVRWIQEFARRYRDGGPTAVADRRHGNPGEAPLLDQSQQAALRAALAGPAPDGGLWTRRQVADWMGRALGRPMSLQWGRQRPSAHFRRKDAWLSVSGFVRPVTGQSWWCLLPPANATGR